MTPEQSNRITVEPEQMGGNPYIRHLDITVWEIYRKLHLEGASDDEILRAYPELMPEDLVAVRDYIPAIIKSRTHDEITGRSILPKSQLKHGAFYKGRGRNVTISRWNAEENCFYHWQEKFRRIVVQTIRYPTDAMEPWEDVFDVVEELPILKFDIPFDQNAAFIGNPGDLEEYYAEMWHRPER